MPHIELNNICKYICRDVNLEILDSELLVLLGPSGAGKTTLLNVIAGLTDYEGSIIFDGVPLDKVDASKRKIGYLFQHLVLFPHLDVASNIAYSLKARKMPKSNIEARVEELLRMLRIKHLSSRYPKHLSGGEKQRVALGRALAHSPKVLLLDEPMSSLDLKTARHLRAELRQLQKELGITAIYVTHDLAEAEEMADRIAVIHSGSIEQVALPDEVFFYPKNEAVSDFIGAPNILDCDSYRELEQGVIEVDCGGLSIIVAHEGNAVQRIALFPRDIYVSDTCPPGPGVNRFEGTITEIKYVDDAVRLDVKVGQKNLVTEVSNHIFNEMDLVVGKEVFLILKLRKIRTCECKCNHNKKG
jgi:ABC-type sugar transport system ATPase subunit